MFERYGNPEKMKKYYRDAKESIKRHDELIREVAREKSNTSAFSVERLELEFCSLLLKYTQWSAPRILREISKKSDKIGERLRSDYEALLDVCDVKRKALEVYLRDRYGIEIQSVTAAEILSQEQGQNDEDWADDKQFYKLFNEWREAERLQEDFSDKYLVVSIDDREKQRRESAQALIEMFDLNSHAAMEIWTEEEREYFQLKRELELRQSYFSLWSNSTQLSEAQESSREGASQLEERIALLKEELKKFIESHPGIREKVEWELSQQRERIKGRSNK